MEAACDNGSDFHKHNIHCYFQERMYDGYAEYYVRSKMPSGMTAEFSFTFYYSGRFKKENKLVPTISFIVYKKRKTAWDIPCELTGKDNLRPLIFAKECLQTLEKAILRTYTPLRYPNIEISIGWEDKKRGDLYSKMLVREGYRMVYEYGEYTLNKYIRKDTIEIVA